jgi:hypothetical protein
VASGEKFELSSAHVAATDSAHFYCRISDIASELSPDQSGLSTVSTHGWKERSGLFLPCRDEKQKESGRSDGRRRLLPDMERASLGHASLVRGIVSKKAGTRAWAVLLTCHVRIMILCTLP